MNGQGELLSDAAVGVDVNTVDSDSLSGVGAVTYAVLGPLLERVRLGEGMLLMVNAVAIAVAGVHLSEALLLIGFSAAVLILLYDFNDLWDAPDDIRNPKKNRRLNATLLRYRSGLFTLHIVLTAAAIALGFSFSVRVGVVVLLLFVVNTLYSTVLKGVAFVDIPIVGLWGGLFVALATEDLVFCGVVGLMTCVMHVFQILVDRNVDEKNGIETSAVRSVRATTVLLLACVLAMAATSSLLVFWPLALLLSSVPLVLHVAKVPVTLAWAGSRVACGLLIVLSLRLHEMLS